MTLELIFTNDTEDEELNKYETSTKRLFEQAFVQTGNSEKPFEVSLSIVDEKMIQDINRDYRQKDAVTDVISFAFLDDNQIVYPEGMSIPLGEIYICNTRMYEQAKDYQHSVEREYHFLALHGLLHLLGYDHMTKEDEKEMFHIQDVILKTLGYERGNE